MFRSTHVTGAIASTPSNLSDDSSDDEEVREVDDDVKLAQRCYRWVTCSSFGAHRGGCKSHMST
jgi:hypothetical protein